MDIVSTFAVASPMEQILAFLAYVGGFAAIPLLARRFGGALGQISGAINDRAKGPFDRARNWLQSKGEDKANINRDRRKEARENRLARGDDTMRDRAIMRAEQFLAGGGLRAARGRDGEKINKVFRGRREATSRGRYEEYAGRRSRSRGDKKDYQARVKSRFSQQIELAQKKARDEEIQDTATAYRGKSTPELVNIMNTEASGSNGIAASIKVLAERKEFKAIDSTRDAFYEVQEDIKRGSDVAPLTNLKKAMMYLGKDQDFIKGNIDAVPHIALMIDEGTGAINPQQDIKLIRNRSTSLAKGLNLVSWERLLGKTTLKEGDLSKLGSNELNNEVGALALAEAVINDVFAIKELDPKTINLLQARVPVLKKVNVEHAAGFNLQTWGACFRTNSVQKKHFINLAEKFILNDAEKRRLVEKHGPAEAEAILELLFNEVEKATTAEEESRRSGPPS